MYYIFVSFSCFPTDSVYNTVSLFGSAAMMPPKGVTMGKILKTSPLGRKCIFLNCTHTLSIYNHEMYCHLHQDQILQKKNPTILELVPLADGIHEVVTIS